MITWTRANKRQGLTLGIFVVLGTLLRLWFIFNIPTEQLYDFDTYYQLAVNVSTGQGYTLGGYPVAWQGMLYSTALGIVFKIVGSTSVLIPKMLNIVMSEMTVVLCFYIMKRIYDKPLAVWSVVTLITFMPQQVAYCNVVGTEIEASFLLILSLTLMLMPMKKHYKSLALGIMSALLSLSKPFFLAFPILIGVYLWLRYKNLKGALVQGLIVFGVMWLIILPWSVRNLQKYDRFIPVSYNSGFNLYINNNAQNVHGGWMDYHEIEKPEALAEAIESEVLSHGDSVKTSPNLEVMMKPYAKKWIVSHPVEFLKLGVIRTHATYFGGAWDVSAWTMNKWVYDEATSGVDVYTFQRNLNLIRAISDILLAFVSVFGGLFVFINIGRILKHLFHKTKRLSDTMLIPVLPLAFVSLVYFVYEGQPRYNFLVVSLLTICFGIGLEMVTSQMKHLSEEVMD